MKVLKKLLSGIKQLVSSPHSTPRSRTLYACTGGKYLGEFFVYMEEQDQVYVFLSMPSMEPRRVPKDKYAVAISNNILDPVEKMPRDVYRVCQCHYIKSNQ